MEMILISVPVHAVLLSNILNSATAGVGKLIICVVMITTLQSYQFTYTGYSEKCETYSIKQN